MISIYLYYHIEALDILDYIYSCTAFHLGHEVNAGDSAIKVLAFPGKLWLKALTCAARRSTFWVPKAFCGTS